ncbi:MAG: RNA 2',3'-cyclic phosphodiesterase [Olsenella sp.]|jgi:2'-5' RNA ligase|nr:RNA 2',3'-cyclic phosphodiesterase [Olsenella sp.]MCI1289896.1 RNA 2',3'-cyclic phosphodiesterase [Olsenella sp.]
MCSGHARDEKDATALGGARPARRRLFIAVLPDDAARAELLRAQRAVLPHLAKDKPTAAANLHLTLAFLGELDTEGEASALAAMHDAVQKFADGGGTPFRIWLGDLGCFGKRRGGIVWQGVAGVPDVEREGRRRLLGLQAGLAAALAAHGIALEARAYTPHLTLARGCRMRPGEAAGDMDNLLARVSLELDAGRGTAGPQAMPVDAISLMWSHHPAGGALTYTEVARVELGRAGQPDSSG